MIIGLCGAQGAGKDTVGGILESKHGFVKLAFASAIKDVLSAMFSWPRDMLEGLTKESREWRETPNEYWSDKLAIPDFSPRKAMQIVGTDLFRNQLNKDIWINIIENKIMMLRESGENHRFFQVYPERNQRFLHVYPERNQRFLHVYPPKADIPKADIPKADIPKADIPNINIVITDCRFANEFDMIRKFPEARIIKIVKDQHVQMTATHSSENDWTNVDCEILKNNGSIESLELNLDNMIYSSLSASSS